MQSTLEVRARAGCVRSIAARAWAAALTLAALAAAPAAADDWPFYRRDLQGTSASAEPLTAAQGATLTPDWVAYTNGYNYSNPIVAGGAVYLTSGDGALYALDALTGALRWKRYASATGPFHCLSPTQLKKGPVGAPAVLGSTVYFPGGDGVVYAFDAATGTPGWSTPIADVPGKGEFLWSSIFPLGDKLLIGVSSLHDCLLVPGRVVSIDRATGSVVGTWWADERHGPGGGVWTQPAYDPATKKLFVTTGTIAAGLTPDQQPLSDAFVALDPATMTALDHYTVPGTFADDIDFGASPTIYDTPAGQHLIAATNKNGLVYGMDRDRLSAGPLWTFRIADFSMDSSPDLGDASIVSAPYVSATGTLFVGGGRLTLQGITYEGSVAALDGATGALKWMIHPQGFVLAAMTTVGDLLFFGATHLVTDPITHAVVSYQGTFYGVSQATGEVIYSQPMGALFGQPTYANGLLYVPDLKGALFALEAPGVGPAPDWSISMAPVSQGLGAGTSVSYTVTTTSVQPIALSVSGLPSNISAAFTPAAAGNSPPSVSAGPIPTNAVKVTLSLPAGSPSANSIRFTVSGAPASGSGRSASAVVVPVASDFRLLAPTVPTLLAGRSVSFAVATQAVGPGAPERIALSVDAPPGISGSYSPAAVLAGASSTLTLTGAPDLADGAAALTLIGVAPSATHRMAARVQVMQRPVAQLISPSPGASVEGSVAVKASASVSAASSLASLTLQVDGAPVASSASSPATFTWDTANVAAGAHALSVVAADAAGNSAASAPVQVTVVRPQAPPPPSPPAPSLGAHGCDSAGAAGLADALSACGLWFALHRRRRR